LESKRKIKHLGKVVIFGSLLLFFISACDNRDNPLVCEAGKQKLYQDELDMLMEFYKDDFQKEELREKVLELWIDQRLIQSEMQRKLPQIHKEQALKIDQEIYYMQLFELENAYIREHIDSVVTQEQIDEYYKSHREKYKASSYVVKALYIKIPDTLSQIEALRNVFLLKNDKDFDEVKKYGNLYATNFYLAKDKWIYFDDLVKEIPMSQQQKKELILNRGKATFELDGYTYFINVIDYRSKRISSPLEIEKSVIKAHILKKRVNRLRKKAKETIIEHVRKNSSVTYH
jgi:hypothetical protein